MKKSFSTKAAATPTPTNQPTQGRCYELCSRAAISDPSWTLVHGRPTLRRAPHVQYGHAWLERDGLVYDPSARDGAGVTMPTALYYALGQIDPGLCTRYSAREGAALMNRTGHHGPWQGVDAPDPAVHTHQLAQWNRLNSCDD
jgi:hypothetical protein